MTEIMPVPRNLNFTVLPAESLDADFLELPDIPEQSKDCNTSKSGIK